MRILIGTMLLAAAGCSNEPDLSQARPLSAAHPATFDGSPTPSPAASTAPAGGANQVAGIAWSVPEGWSVQPPKPMRVATYTIPRGAGDSDDGSCAVHYFGADQGGSVEANLERWYGQMQDPGGKSIRDLAKRDGFEVDGIQIVRIDVTGTFMWSASPMSPDKTPKPNWRLLGAIATAPAGSVFFKLTAPAAGAGAAAAPFEAMLRSIHRAAP